MIRRFHAKNFGCLKDVSTPELTRLHAFIGPNDSGKSKLLRAMESLIDVLAHRNQEGLVSAITRVHDCGGTKEARLVADTSHGFIGFEAQPGDFTELAGPGQFGVEPRRSLGSYPTFLPRLISETAHPPRSHSEKWQPSEGCS